MTIRTHYGASTSVTNTGVTSTVLTDMNRPRSLPVEATTTDFTARSYTRQEFEGGSVVTVTFTASGGLANLSVRAVEIIGWDGNVARTVLSTTGDAYLATAADTTALLSSMLLSEDEAGVRLTVGSASGLIFNVQAFAKFDFGLNSANYGSVA